MFQHTGANHARLLALGTRDLFEADRSQDLSVAGVGTQESTFMGLRDMQLAAGAHDLVWNQTLS